MVVRIHRGQWQGSVSHVRKKFDATDAFVELGTVGAAPCRTTLNHSQAVEMLLIIVIVLLLLWTPGYYGYGRSRWGWGYGGDVLTLILVIVLLWVLFGGRM